MKKIKTKLPGVYIIEPEVFEDDRGWFSETYNKNKYKDVGIDVDFVQDNHSFSAEKGTLRGIHFQLGEMAQTKLVRCTRGKVFDIAVDLRRESDFFGKWFGVELSAENKRQLFIPRGFGHGFLTLTEECEFVYKVDNYYSSEHDRSILWCDPEINVDWPIMNPELSNKDKLAQSLKDIGELF